MNQVICTRKRNGLIAGLTWQPLVAATGSLAEAKKLVKQDTSIKKFAIAGSKQAAVGFYHVSDGVDWDSDDADDSAEDVPTSQPATLHSLALAYAHAIGNQSGVLAYAIDMGTAAMSAANDTHYAIVVVDAGCPRLDQIKTASEMDALLAYYGTSPNGVAYTVHSNTAALIDAFGGKAITEDQLWSATNKATLLQSRPLNMRLLLASVVSITLLIGGGLFAKKYAADISKANAIEQARQNDPLPPYQTLLETQLGQLGWTAEQMDTTLDALGAQPTRQVGWNLGGIVCSMTSQTCESTWIRNGGTSSELIAARAIANEVPLQQPLASTGLDSQSFTLPMKLTPSGVGAKSDLPSQAATGASSITSQYQSINTAGIAVTLEGFMSWPSYQKSAQLPPTELVFSRKFSFSSDLPLAREVVGSLPKNVYWAGIRIQLDPDARNPSEAMKVSLSGVEYVQ